MILLKKFLKQLVVFLSIISIFFSFHETSIAKQDVEEVQIIIIVPINPYYDPNSLKQFSTEFMGVVFKNGYPTLASPTEVAEAYPIGSKEYTDYLEIYNHYYSSDPTKAGELLLDQDGFYYPVITQIIGTGDQEDIITLSTTLLTYFLINESGEVATSGDEPYARVYSTVIESNNVSINEKNVKFEIAYRSYDTMEVDGVEEDVRHTVVSDQQDWVRLSDATVTLDDKTLEAGDYTAVINGMSRTYIDPAPTYDNAQDAPVWDYYQDPGKVNLIPMNPQIDDEYMTLVEESAGGTYSTVDTLHLVNNTSAFKALISGRLVSTDAVYFAFIDYSGDDSIDITEYQLNNMSIDIYTSDGATSSYSGTPVFSDTNPGLTGLIHNFSFKTSYKDLLAALADPMQDSFDIVLKGAANNGKTVEVVLDDISLPAVKVNSVTLSNETTEMLWNSLGFSTSESTNYSMADFTNTGTSLISLTRGGNDGNYAKNGDVVTVSANYSFVGAPKYSFDENFNLLLDGINCPPISSIHYPSTEEVAHTFTIGYLSGGNKLNGAAYINAGTTDENSERIKVLYVDNVTPGGEGAAASTQYINNSNSKIDYTSDEEGKGSTEEELTTGYTGVRAYINLFSYESAQSDMPNYNTINDPGISGLVHSGTNIADKYYTRVVRESSGAFNDPISVDDTGHTNDGGYHIHKVMAVDKAGNVATDNKTDLTTIASQMNSSSTISDYYVDTINPVLNTSLVKSSDLYSELNSAFGVPAVLPFKNGDELELSFSINDYNPDTYSLAESGTVDVTNSYSFPYTGASPLTFTVENLTTQDSGNSYPLFTLTATDKAGNSSIEPVTGRLLNTIPSQVSLQLFEDHWNWLNSNTGITGSSSLTDPNDSDYVFSKGATTSNSSSPDIYITGDNFSAIDNDANDGNNVIVIGANINGQDVYYNHGSLSPGQSALNLTDINTNDSSINGFYLVPNSKNTVKVVPYGPSGVKGFEYLKKVLVDTMVNSNTTLISNGTYLPSTEKYRFDLDFSKISEFAGLTGYKVNKIESKTGNTVVKTYDNSASTTYTSLSTVPSTSLTQSSGLTDTLEFNKTDVMPGSRSKLFIDVIDSLGSEREIEFTLLVPEPSLNLKAKTANSNRMRETSVKVVGESNGNKGFGINSIEEKGE